MIQIVLIEWFVLFCSNICVNLNNSVIEII